MRSFALVAVAIALLSGAFSLPLVKRSDTTQSGKDHKAERTFPKINIKGSVTNDGQGCQTGLIVINSGSTTDCNFGGSPGQITQPGNGNLPPGPGQGLLPPGINGYNPPIQITPGGSIGNEYGINGYGNMGGYNGIFGATSMSVEEQEFMASSQYSSSSGIVPYGNVLGSGGFGNALGSGGLNFKEAKNDKKDTA